MVQVVECDRQELSVLYKDEALGKLVLADTDYNELEVPLAQLGDAADAVDSGSRVSLLTHNGEVVKIVPPPEVAAALQQEHRRVRREQLQGRKAIREREHELADLPGGGGGDLAQASRAKANQASGANRAGFWGDGDDAGSDDDEGKEPGAARGRQGRRGEAEEAWEPQWKRVLRRGAG